MRTLAVALCAFVVIACTSGCSSKDDECYGRMADIERCGLRYGDQDVCETPDGQCAIECHYQAGCDVLERLAGGAEPPASYRRCVAQCVEPFRCDEGGTTINARWRCDGEADCQDGADEAGCDYHACDDGQLVREGARCDEYPHCSDGSDEEGC